MDLTFPSLSEEMGGRDNISTPVRLILGLMELLGRVFARFQRIHLILAIEGVKCFHSETRR